MGGMIGMQSEDKAGGPLTMEAEQNGVTVKVTYNNSAVKEAPEFVVKLDTHSVSLDQYDLKQLSTLRNDRGVAVKPVSFEKKGSGHHIQNILAFPAKDEAGKLVAGDGATSLELVLFDIADVPQRLLRWEVK